MYPPPFFFLPDLSIPFNFTKTNKKIKMDFPILNHDLELKEIDFQCTLSTLGTRNNNCHLTSIITCLYIYIYIYIDLSFFFFW